MGLDIDLIGEEKETVCYACNQKHKEKETLFNTNITHNLGEMAREAGIYKALWRPEEIDAKIAKDIIDIVESGLIDLKSRPEHFRKFDSPNGWGTYKHFVPFVEEYLKALKEYPDAEIEISR